VKPHGHATIPLPACTQPVRWSVTSGASAGTVHLGGATIDYAAPATPGTETIGLDHAKVIVKVTQPWMALTPLAPAPGAAPVVRAMGDSVTAGFGYYGDGSQMGVLELYECRPFGEVLDDACSSNSTATKNGLKEVPYAPDYGLSNNISWAAQWANDYGVTNYKNYAISGSEPTNWAPGGSLYATTQKIESEDPDYVLMTIGANPILANTLFGLGPALCAFESDIVGGYSTCVEEAFESVHLRTELKRLYTDLVEKTHATIYLMQYHLSIPASALAYSVAQIAEMAKLMNETIAEVAREVNPTRLQVVTPPHFNVGVSLEPVYPSAYTCSYLEYGVDGPSVQSTATQVELKLGHYLSFCEGPTGGGEPWVISADTGIHPSAAGYQQMAGKVPAPAPGG
jgi:lysophospholipase L1-like esterase